ADGAYVANHVLVATIPAVGFTLSGAESPFRVKLVGGVLTAPLDGEGAATQLKGATLAGRWNAIEMLSALTAFQALQMPLCKNNPVYEPVKGAICNARDILSNASLATSTPCDSLSVGVGFDASQAKIGLVVPADPPVVCPAGQDPATDKCD